MKIYKYVLNTDRENVIEMPIGVIIHCHEQNNKPCIWVVFKDETVKSTRKFVCMVTGVEFGVNHNHIGTCHLDNGKFVTHIFEII